MPIVNNTHDQPEMVQARKEQMDPWVMYIVVRESLDMSVGKLAAQVGHAVGMVYNHYNYLKDVRAGAIGERWLDLKLKMDYFDLWQRQSFRKILLRADEKEWQKLKDQLECHLVIDAGLTEVEPGTETIIALWPMLKSTAPRLVKRLRLL